MLEWDMFVACGQQVPLKRQAVELNIWIDTTHLGGARF